MKLTIINRHPDGQPILDIEAEDKAEKNQLTLLRAELHQVQLRAVKYGRAGRHNACGCCGGDEGIESLVFEVSLGGPSGDQLAELGRDVVELVARFIDEGGEKT